MKAFRQIYYTPDETATEAQKWLCRVLNRRGISQAELATELHTTRQAISKLVNGHTKMTFDKVCAIYYVCHLSEDPEDVWNRINA